MDKLEMVEDMDRSREIESLVVKVISLNNNEKREFWSKLWSALSPYDLYLVQSYLDPKPKGPSLTEIDSDLTSEQVGGIQFVRGVQNFVGRPLAEVRNSSIGRFDILTSLSHLPECLELVLSHLTIVDIVSAQKVNRSWSNLLRWDQLYYRLVTRFYPIQVDKEVTSPSSNLFDSFIGDKNKRLWYQLYLQLNYLQRELTLHPRITHHQRISLTSSPSTTTHDPLLFLTPLDSDSLLGVVKKSSGAKLFHWTRVPSSPTRDPSASKLSLKSYSLSPTSNFDLPNCPSAITTDPERRWLAFSTYLRHDPGPKLYSLEDSRLVWDPRSSLDYLATGAILALLTFQMTPDPDSGSYLAAGSADGRVFIWWIPSDLVTTSPQRESHRPSLVTVITPTGLRVPIIGLHFLAPHHLIVISRHGLITLFDLTLNPTDHSANPSDPSSHPPLLFTPTCSHQLPLTHQGDPEILHKFHSRGRNLILTSLTTLYHLILLHHPPVNFHFLYSLTLPCQPSSLSSTLRPLATLHPLTLQLHPLPYYPSASSTPPYPIYAPLLTNLHPAPSPPLYLLPPHLLPLRWHPITGGLPPSSSRFTTLTPLTPHHLAVGSKGGYLHLLQFPALP